LLDIVPNVAAVLSLCKNCVLFFASFKTCSTVVWLQYYLFIARSNVVNSLCHVIWSVQCLLWFREVMYCCTFNQQIMLTVVLEAVLWTLFITYCTLCFISLLHELARCDRWGKCCFVFACCQ